MSANPFTPFLEARGVVVLDGGSATALEARGHELDGRLWSASLLQTAPDAIVDVHRGFLEAGADCVISVSYQASFPGLLEAGLDDAGAEALLVRSSELALAARDSFVADDPERVRPLVAASVGPYGAYLADGSEYDGRYAVDDAELKAFHRRRLHLLSGTGVDLLACETIPSGREARVLLELLAERPDDVPAWLSFSCRDGARLRDGTPVEEVARACRDAPRVAAVGLNCTAPRHVSELVRRIRSAWDGPVVAYPNSGELYDATSGSWSEGVAGGATDDAWLSSVLSAREAGAEILGGCCRVGPADIAELRRRLIV
ncbi:MAG: homocysteine S-methyltransferase [Longimicrobiales bacterium]|nr:homocysteine S-methyltransferase [Longimicrobiales bacterium]